MNEIIATATQMKNNFGKYMELVLNGKEIIVTKNGKEIGRFIPKDKTATFLSEQLLGIIKEEDYNIEREKALSKKYEMHD